MGECLLSKKICTLFYMKYEALCLQVCVQGPQECTQLDEVIHQTATKKSGINPYLKYRISIFFGPAVKLYNLVLFI